MRALLPMIFLLGDQICRIHNNESLKGAKATALAIAWDMLPARSFNIDELEETKLSQFVHRHLRFPPQRLETESTQISADSGTVETNWQSAKLLSSEMGT